MANERYYKTNNRQGDFYTPGGPQDADRYYYGPNREYGYSSARDYEAAGEIGRDRQGDRHRGDYYGRRDPYDGGGGDAYGSDDYYRARPSYGSNRGSAARPYYSSYASDRNDRHADQRTDWRERNERRERWRDDDRDFMSRAGDEVRSWFGDEDAERRREMDRRRDQMSGGRSNNRYDRDDDYHSWRQQQIDSLDRDYAEYRNENRQKFHNEFGSWRSERQSQRAALNQVSEHMEVVGSDGEHVGTVDKVRGDRIILTKNDPDSGGHHHSIPSRWISSVDDKVHLRKTADEAQTEWRDAERNQAMFGDNAPDYEVGAGAHNLDRSFSGTY